MVLDWGLAANSSSSKRESMGEEGLNSTIEGYAREAQRGMAEKCVKGTVRRCRKGRGE